MKRLLISAIIALVAVFSAAAQSSLPHWIIGKWTDEGNIYLFSDTKVSLYDTDMKHISDGIFELETGDSILYVYFSNGDEASFILDYDHQGLCYEGGDDLYPIINPELAWLYGKWEAPDTPKTSAYYACVIITPLYTQTYGAMWNDEDKTIDQMPKKAADITVNTTSIDGTYIIDHKRKAIYWIYDFDREMHLKKVE